VNDDEIRARLRTLGTEPIDEQTRAAHLRRMSAGGSVAEPRRRGFVWAGIAAAAVVGFLAGSTGLAMADALPDPAQAVAHDVLRVVQVDVPQGKEGKRGPCVAEAAKIKDKDAKKAAKDACPKGGGEESGDEDSQGGEAPGTPPQGPPAADACHGRPPWAGPMSKEQREAAKASASRANCPKDADEGEDESESADIADAATTTESTTVTTTTTAPTAPTAPSGIDESSSDG